MTYQEFINNILLARGRNGCGEAYHEEHHIIPRCMGGLNDKDNLIDLFAEEHFLAHKLLALENPDNDALQRAFSAMAHVWRHGRRCNVSDEDYAYIKSKNSQRLKQQWDNPEYRTSMSNMMTELWKDPEFKAKATASWENEHRRKEQADLMKKLNSDPNIITKKTNALHKWCDKAVQQLDNNGNVIAEFPSATEASRQTGIQQSCISRCCNRLQNIAGGFRWQFLQTFN